MYWLSSILVGVSYMDMISNLTETTKNFVRTKNDILHPVITIST